ncbi:RND transporter MFP subunit [Pseudomonas turukhanskensis]|uniref:RND transporter MFP subunit n=2 Tax=Pseudomonas turukhanskensis TaxID=1806536 RepID=A0A9W6K6B1_9PSED|nr:RND transporter MFP subunit [Pseudomonas turukhanskensis]
MFGYNGRLAFPYFPSWRFGMRTRSKLVVFVLALVVIAVAAKSFMPKTAAGKTAGPVGIPVHVVAVKQQDVPRFISGIGTVLSLHSVVVRPQIDGVLTQLLVKEGQWVKAGDLMAQIDDRAIRASLDQAKAQLGQAQAQLHVAEVDLKRYKVLSVDDGVSKQTLDQQQALYDQLKATVQGNQASIAAAQVQLSYTQIRSPVAGRVGIRTVDPGNFLRVSDAQGLFSVTQMDPIAVEFSLPQNLLPTLQQLLNAPAPALVNAYLSDHEQSGSLLAQGQLRLIDNQVSATTGTLRAKAEFANAAQTLWPGQLVTVKVQTAIDKDALVVPPQVVQRGLEQYFVYRVNGDAVQSVPVKLLYQDSELNIIQGVQPADIQAGTVLVRDGQSRLKPGAKIEVLSDEPTTTPVQP